MQLSEWLETRGVSTPDFAKRIGVSLAYAHYLRGGQRRPSLAVARKIEIETDGAVTADDWLSLPRPARSKREFPDRSGRPKKERRGPVKKGRRTLTDTTETRAVLHD